MDDEFEPIHHPVTDLREILEVNRLTHEILQGEGSHRFELMRMSPFYVWLVSEDAIIVLIRRFCALAEDMDIYNGQ